MKETAVITCGNVNYAVHHKLVTRVLWHLDQQVVTGRDSGIVKKCDFLEWLFSLTKLRTSSRRISSKKMPLSNSIIYSSLFRRPPADQEAWGLWIRGLRTLYEIWDCCTGLCSVSRIYVSIIRMKAFLQRHSLQEQTPFPGLLCFNSREENKTGKRRLLLQANSASSVFGCSIERNLY